MTLPPTPMADGEEAGKIESPQRHKDTKKKAEKQEIRRHENLFFAFFSPFFFVSSW
jgi:hypothetical protein